MTMGMVDTLIVGPLGPEAIGAVGVGTSIFMGVCIFAMGLLLGLDTLVSQAFGADDIDDCHRWLVHGVVLAVGAQCAGHGPALLDRRPVSIPGAWTRRCS